MPTSVFLFPESASPAPEVNGYVSEPLGDALASVRTDTGAKQVRKRHDDLMGFRYRTIPKYRTQLVDLHTFIDRHGVGDVNFTFYEPYALYYSNLLVGVTDGTGESIASARALASYTDFLIGGISVMSTGGWTHTQEYVTPTKEDRLEFGVSIGTPSAGLDITFDNVYARERYICHMISWRRYAYEGGRTAAEEFHPTHTTVPLFPMVYEFNFEERG